ncbi:aminotransferase class V-fold PLP-dependent enzyme [Salininema proteolyticum]|uniref:Aminotransferase class V-fold PLP-dependent enzyme n=1 Tax=Salininema proteolyticum TaxID=1607685 RepID=A0ABV8TX91_9ACTN
MIDAAALARHYTRFGVADRLLLTGHSHQAWPDVSREAVLAAWDDAARHVDEKWDAAFARAERARGHLRVWLDDPGGEFAFGANTRELLARLLSAVDLEARPHVVTTDTEFHSAARQFDRLAETRTEVSVVPAQPVGTLAERLAEACRPDTALVYASTVLFKTSQRVPHLDRLLAGAREKGAEVLLDAYHHIGPVRFSVGGLGVEEAWITGGGYKYLQWGEGVCYLRLPAHSDEFRPVDTGWYATFGDLAGEQDSERVPYADGAARWAGSTYDPTSHYRAAAVGDFFAEQGLTPEALAENYRRQTGLLMDSFDALGLPDDVVTRDRSLTPDLVGGFLALESPVAERLRNGLADRGVLTDSRGRWLRFGPAPYLTDDQLERAVAALGEVAAQAIASHR